MQFMSFGRIGLTIVILLGAAATASADTVRVIVERALVWTQPSGVSIVMTQLLKDQRAEVVRRVGDWFEIVAPPGSGGGDRRTGFISASQVVLEASTPRSPAPPSAIGQPPRASAPPPRRRSAPRSTRILYVDGAYRAGAEDFTRTFTAFKDRFAEDGSIATNFGNRSGPAVDLFFAEPLSGAFGVGVGADVYVRSTEATVNATVPHPFFFNQPRSATFETAGLSSREIAFNISGTYTPPDAGPVKILVFGGPTIFNVSQIVVTDVTLRDQYPYDTTTITGIKSERLKANLFGFHLGTDLTYFLSPLVGIGGGARYTRATLKFDNDPGPTVKGLAGGVQATFGVRLRF